jgi:hypothetical protein
MRKIMFKISILISTLLFAAPASAGTVTQGNVNVVKVLAGYTSGEVYFYTDIAPVNPNNCSITNDNNKILAVDPSKSNVDQVLSILLMAKASNAKLEIQVYDDSCYGSYAVIRRVAVY